MSFMNKSKNVLSETQARLDKMQSQKNHDIEIVDAKLVTLKAELTDLETELHQATADMNLERYAELSDQIKNKTIAIEMYEAKKESLTNSTGISKTESDQIIDRLIAYQNVLNTDFVSDIAEPIAQLKKIHDDYEADLTALKNTIARWQEETGIPYRSSQILPSIMKSNESTAVGNCINKLNALQILSGH